MGKICVIISTYNGSKYLDELLCSVCNQTYVDLEIWARDDGSTDETKNILEKYSGEKFKWICDGDNLGPATSFLKALKTAPQADYYAFCDQDDVWDQDKLSSAISMIENCNDYDCSRPIMYYSNVEVVDEKLSHIKLSDYNVPFNDLNYTLFHSTAAGCTIVMNRKLRDLLNQYMPSYISMHDSWTHKVCLALNGIVLFDKKAHIKYRQHQNNQVGFENNKLSFAQGFGSPICQSSKSAQEILKGYGPMLDQKARRSIECVANYTTNFHEKFRLLTDKSFYSDSFLTNLREHISVLRNRR